MANITVKKMVKLKGNHCCGKGSNTLFAFH